VALSRSARKLWRGVKWRHPSFAGKRPFPYSFKQRERGWLCLIYVVCSECTFCWWWQPTVYALH